MSEQTSGFKAANPDNQTVVDSFLREGKFRACSHCGAPMLRPAECAACHGEDDYDGLFCSVEDYCCGC